MSDEVAPHAVGSPCSDWAPWAVRVGHDEDRPAKLVRSHAVLSVPRIMPLTAQPTGPRTSRRLAGPYEGWPASRIRMEPRSDHLRDRALPPPALSHPNLRMSGA